MTTHRIASPDDILSAARTLAPDALDWRAALRSTDWAKAKPADVHAVLASLEARKQIPPLWLARNLLLAGHALTAAASEGLPRELRTLELLNRSGQEPGSQPPLQSSDIDTLRLDEQIEPEVIRAIAARLVALGSGDAACRLALSRWCEAADTIKPLRATLPGYIAALPRASLHVTAFSTTDVLCADMKLACAASGWQADISHSAFGEVIATLLAPRADMDAQVLLLDAAHLVERDWRASSSDSLAAITAWAEMLAGAIQAYARATAIPLLVNTLPIPAVPTAGWRDGDHALGLKRAVSLVNEHLIGLARTHAGVHLIDADAALAQVAPTKRFDAKLWYYGRVAYGAEASRALATGFAQCIAALRLGPAKVLAIDLDNTLWGGVYGDDGIERLQCGEEAPGNAFQAFQRECLRLKRQGMILVALSKNNPDAIDVFERHPGMLLKAADFSATAIDWEPKPRNLCRISEELRLGLDSFVFLDDSPHEREAMRRLLPQVNVPEMPADPARRPEWLRRQQITWPLRLTEEDEQRAQFYTAETQARALKASAATFTDYLRGLDQHLDITPVTSASLARAAQMHQRTNQFNLTTRRLTESDITAMTADPATGLALLGRVHDKFGDHGLTIAATVSIAGNEAEIVTFLMSCRVIGREVERAFLGALIAALSGRGVRRVKGTYVATAKNLLARDFYEQNGFRPLAKSDTQTSWEFTIGEDALPSSPHVIVALEG